MVSYDVSFNSKAGDHMVTLGRSSRGLVGSCVDNYKLWKQRQTMADNLLEKNVSEVYTARM